jgi:hypothetical protein
VHSSPERINRATARKDLEHQEGEEENN